MIDPSMILPASGAAAPVAAAPTNNSETSSANAPATSILKRFFNFGSSTAKAATPADDTLHPIQFPEVDRKKTTVTLIDTGVQHATARTVDVAGLKNNQDIYKFNKNKDVLEVFYGEKGIKNGDDVTAFAQAGKFPLYLKPKITDVYQVPMTQQGQLLLNRRPVRVVEATVRREKQICYGGKHEHPCIPIDEKVFRRQLNMSDSDKGDMLILHKAEIVRSSVNQPCDLVAAVRVNKDANLHTGGGHLDNGIEYKGVYLRGCTPEQKGAPVGDVLFDASKDESYFSRDPEFPVYGALNFKQLMDSVELCTRPVLFNTKTGEFQRQFFPENLLKTAEPKSAPQVQQPSLSAPSHHNKIAAEDFSVLMDPSFAFQEKPKLKLKKNAESDSDSSDSDSDDERLADGMVELRACYVPVKYLLSFSNAKDRMPSGMLAILFNEIDEIVRETDNLINQQVKSGVISSQHKDIYRKFYSLSLDMNSKTKGDQFLEIVVHPAVFKKILESKQLQFRSNYLKIKEVGLVVSPIENCRSDKASSTAALSALDNIETLYSVVMQDKIPNADDFTVVKKALVETKSHCTTADCSFSMTLRLYVENLHEAPATDVDDATAYNQRASQSSSASKSS